MKKSASQNDVPVRDTVPYSRESGTPKMIQGTRPRILFFGDFWGRNGKYATVYINGNPLNSR